MAKYVLSLVQTEDLQAILKPHQFGVGFSNGCETALHTIQQCLSNPQERYVAMCIDYKNAFNCVGRSEMITQLFKHKALQPIWSFCHWCYSSPTNLALRNRDGTYNITKFLMSVCGCRQGGPESALLFAIALQPVLIELSRKYPSIIIVAYLDDVTILGPNADMVIKAYEFLKAEAKRILNLEVETKKCKFIYFNNGSNIDHLDAQPPILTNDNEELSAQVILERYGIPIYRDAAIILGSAVGCDESKIHDILLEHIGESHNQLFNLLQHPSLSVRNAMLLLRQCMVPKLNYLTRTVAPIVINSILQSFDTKVINTALHILDINQDLAGDSSVRARVVNQLRACLRTGGFGLISRHPHPTLHIFRL